jgi:EmrB/QacA subfamily drug resistance transporter
MFMELLDGSILATAAPSMARSFGVRADQISIAITVYLIVLAVLIPLSGWIADSWGSRPTFLASIVVFTLASALCAGSSSLAQLTGVRAVQGAGAAMMVPVGRLVVLRATDRDSLVDAIAFLSWPAVAAPVVAPVLGGLLTAYLSWRWIFLVNLPLGVVAFALALRLVPQVRAQARAPFDWLGFFFGGLSLVALITSAAVFAADSSDLWAPASLGVLTVAAGAVAVREMLRNEHPLLDLALFRIPSFRIVHRGGLLFRLAFNAVPFLLPLLFQVGFGWSPARSGVLLAVLFVGNLVGKPFVTPLMRRFTPRRLFVAAALVGALSILAFGFVDPDRTPLWAFVFLLFASGVSRSMGATVLMTITFADVDEAGMGQANTISATAFQIALGLGVALGALALHVGESTPAWLGGGTTLAAYRTAFAALAAISVLAAVDGLRLAADAAVGLVGSRRPRRSLRASP